MSDKTPFELFHSYRRGLQDAMRFGPQDERFINHKDRPDIREAYTSGFEDGYAFRKERLDAAATRFGYVPNILRAV